MKATLNRQEHPKKFTHSQVEEIKKEQKNKKQEPKRRAINPMR